MKKVLLIGEPLIRISPLRHQELMNGVDAAMFFGGSEVNIACTLQGFGLETSLFSALPQNAMGDRFSTFLSSHGIDTSRILRLGDRIGLYYLEEGFGCRSSQVYYDRKQSSFTQIKKDTLDLSQILKGVDWLHFSGITLSISPSIPSWLKELLRLAKARQIPISFDLNWRSTLIELKNAKPLFSEFAHFADYCFGIEPLMINQEDWGLFNRDTASEQDLHLRMQAVKELFELKGVFHTVRYQDQADRQVYQAYGLMEDFAYSKKVRTQVLQRVGSGDAFVAGALYQLSQGSVLQEVLDFGVAAGVYKCSLEGDSMSQPVEKIYSILDNRKDIVR